MAEYEKKVRIILKEHGFIFKRWGKGDHEIWFNPDNGRTVPVAVKIKSRHSANGILKECNIDYRFLKNNKE